MTSPIAQGLFWSSLFLLVYIYAGYPILAWLRARRASKWKPYCPTNAPAETTVAIVIGAHNEAQILPTKVRNLLASSVSSQIKQILIGSDGSTDATRAAVDEIGDPRVRVIEFPERRGKPSILNDLVPLCESEIVVMADSRQMFEADCIEQLLAHFGDPTVGVVSGELILRQRADQTTAAAGIGFYWRYEKFIRRCESLANSVPGATGACYALRRSLFRPIPAETILDDVVIPMQAVEQGYRCLFEPKAIVYDEPSKSTRQESIRKRRTIAGVAQVARLYPRWLLPWKNPVWFEFMSHKLLRLVSPPLMIVCLLANVALLSQPVYQWIFGLQLAFYASAMIGMSLQLAGKGSRLFGPPLMFVTLNLTTAAALWDALRSRYRVTWQKAG